MHKQTIKHLLKSKHVYLGIALAILGTCMLILVTSPNLFFSAPIPIGGHTLRVIGMMLRIPTLTPTPTPTPDPTATPTPLPTPTPTPRPPTFAELSAQYGPCAVVPVLMYHHIQDLNVAREEGHASLTVDVGLFQKQMQYVKDHAYTPIRPEQLIAFFDGGTSLPGKPVLLTFDDGYSDFSTDALPILRAFGFTAIAFIPTGLLENPGYMSWGNVTDAASGNLIYIANHTWSHKSVTTSLADDQTEIGTADQQLTQHGLNNAKVFAYPYGYPSANGTMVLSALGYKLGFTTYPGWTQCRGQRFFLPRMRIGNANLNSYGL